MMVFFGLRHVHLKTVQLDTAVCPKCNTKGSLILSIYRRHSHIFFIPLHPYNKNGVTECQNCGDVMKSKNMPEDIKREYKLIKSETGSPLWQFSGLIIIIGIVFWGIYSDNQKNERNFEYISSPQIGDVYEYKLEKGRYTTLKVFKVSADSVFMLENDFEIDKSKQMDVIDKPENYTNYTSHLSKTELSEMFENKVILDVKREK